MRRVFFFFFFSSRRRHTRLTCDWSSDVCSSDLVRMVQWPSYHQPVLNSVRLDTRFAELLEPLIGSHLKQIINQVHWKVPGSLGRSEERRVGKECRSRGATDH